MRILKAIAGTVIFGVWLLVLLSGDCLAQTVWTKVATEGASEATAPVVTIKAGQTYRFGSGTKWCAPVTVKVDTQVRVWWSDMGCADPAPGVLKELDLQVDTSGKSNTPTTGQATDSTTPPQKPSVTCTSTVTLTTNPDGSHTLSGGFACPVTP